MENKYTIGVINGGHPKIMEVIKEVLIEKTEDPTIDWSWESGNSYFYSADKEKVSMDIATFRSLKITYR